jgi:hypothetical protein
MCITSLRILPTRADRIFCYFAIAFVIASWLSTIIVFIYLQLNVRIYIFLDKNYAYFTTSLIARHWDLTINNKIINQEAAIIASAVMNSISDFLVFL